MTDIETGFLYRNRLRYTGSIDGALTDYQKKITVYKGTGTDSDGIVYLNNHCQDDFDDIRFTEDDGLTLMDYWIESYVAGTSAVVVIEFAYFPASPTTVDFYIYYEKATAESQSNGINTYLFFDNFNDNDITDWATGLITGRSDTNVANGYVYSDSADNTNSKKKTLSPVIPGIGVAWHYRIWADFSYIANTAYPVLTFSGSNSFADSYVTVPEMGSAPGNELEIRLDGWSTVIARCSHTFAASTWYEIDIAHLSNGTWKVWIDGVPKTLTLNTANTDIPTFNTVDFSFWGYQERIDDIRVRKYTANEPVFVEWGGEEYFGYERYNATLLNSGAGAYGGTWAAQTLTVGTVGLNEMHLCTSVRLLLSKTGTVPSVRVGIFETDIEGKPDVSDPLITCRWFGIYSGALEVYPEKGYVSILPDRIVLPGRPETLEANKKYAIVLWFPTGNESNFVVWNGDYNFPTDGYVGGKLWISVNWGGTWTASDTGSHYYDLDFQIFGEFYNELVSSDLAVATDAKVSHPSAVLSSSDVAYTFDEKITYPQGLIIRIDDEEVKRLKYSLNMRKAIGERSITSFTVVDEDASNIYTKGQTTDVLYSNELVVKKIWSGKIEDVERLSYPKSESLFHTIRCVDWMAVCDRHLVAEGYVSKTCGFIVNDIITNYLAEDGIVVGRIDDGVTINEMVINYVPASEVFRTLAERCDFIVYIDESKKLYFMEKGVLTAPFVVDTSIIRKMTPVIRENAKLYRNRQYVRGKGKTSEQTETFIGDGENKAFTVGYAILEEPTVTVDGVDQDVGLRGVETDRDCYWSKGDKVITFDVEPPDTKLVVIVYFGEYSGIVFLEDVGQIASRKLIEGGSGIYEAIDDAIGAATIEEVQEVGSARLLKYGTIGDIFEFETYNEGLEPAQIVIIDYPKLGKTGAEQSLIESVEISYIAPETLLYSVKAINGAEEGDWSGLFRKLARQKEDIYDRLNIGAGAELVIGLQTSDRTGINESIVCHEGWCPFPSPFRWYIGQTNIYPSETNYSC